MRASEELRVGFVSSGRFLNSAPLKDAKIGSVFSYSMMVLCSGKYGYKRSVAVML